MKNKQTFKFYNTDAKNKIRLVIFPYAGAGASVFKDWSNYLAPEIEICSLQLPGREDRFYEKPYQHIDTLLQELSENLQLFVDLPYVCFGHSMGTLLCYEFCRFLEGKETPLPLHVFLSGAYPPPGEDKKGTLSHNYSDEELINELMKINGIPSEIQNNMDLLKLFLPTVRADFLLLGSYQYNNEYQFSMPITVFSGESDTLVDCSELRKWNNFTKGYCRIITLPGDHFCLFSDKENFLSQINRELRFLLAA